MKTQIPIRASIGGVTRVLWPARTAQVLRVTFFPQPEGEEPSLQGNISRAAGERSLAPPALLQEGGDTVHKGIVTQSKGTGKHTFSCT